MNTKQLRQRILDRAIRGQLVPQDPTDEPASVLLERIRAEKEKLIKEKKLKREKRDNQPIEEIPFEIPEGWVWCRLGEIGEIIGGGTPSTSVEEYWNGEVSWITPADLSNYSNKYITRGKRNITQLGLENSSTTLIPKGGILFSTRAPIGYVAIADKPLSTNQGFKNLYPFMDISKEFIYYFLLAEKERIKLFASGTTFQELSTSAFSKILISLPPLAEQHRIVQKIEQLFALVDIIEVNKKALEKLIEQAKSQVLSDAIAGKLTHQDPNDEPAEELLKRIGKTTASDTPYEKILPKGWVWCRLGDIVNIKTGKKDANYGDKDGKYPFFTCALLPIKCNNYSFDMEAILLPGNGANVGEVIYFKGKFEAYQRTYILNFSIEYIRFFYYVLKALWKKSLEGKQFGSATNYIRLSNIEELIIPLPPLKEQLRIVQKIENYFSFFDTIESNL